MNLKNLILFGGEVFRKRPKHGEIPNTVLYSDESPINGVFCSLRPLLSPTKARLYLGTLKEVNTYFGKLPDELYIIINGCPTESEKLFLEEITKGKPCWVSTDSNSGSGHFGIESSQKHLIYI